MITSIVSVFVSFTKAEQIERTCIRRRPYQFCQYMLVAIIAQYPAINESHFIRLLSMRAISRKQTFVNAGCIKIFSLLPSLVMCKVAPNYRTRKAHNDLTPTWGRWSHFHANLVSRGSNEAMAVKQISEADTRAEHLSILWFSKRTFNSRKCLCGIRFLTKLLPYQDRV